MSNDSRTGEKRGTLESTLGRGSSGSGSGRGLRIHKDLVFFSDRLGPPSSGLGEEAGRGVILGDSTGEPTVVLRARMSKLKRFLGSLLLPDIMPLIDEERRGVCSSDVRG